MQTIKRVVGDGAVGKTSPDVLYNEHISLWVCTSCFWQLCSHTYDWWRAIYSWTFWYYWVWGLRQITTSELPTNIHISSLFFTGLSFCIWKCERKVSAWDNSAVSIDSFLACWGPYWSQRWPVYYLETCQEPAAYHSRDCWKAGPWIKYVECLVCGVFRIHTQRPKECIWRSSIGCPGASRTKDERQVCDAVNISPEPFAHSSCQYHTKSNI